MPVVEMVVCNGRKCMLEPEWMRVRLSLKQKSMVDYIITDSQLMALSGNVHEDKMLRPLFNMDRIAKNFKKEKRVSRRWCLDRFEEDEVS